MTLTAESLIAFPGARLSPRERVAVVLLCRGLTCKQIAVRSETTEQVIKNRVLNIYRKLGVNNRVQLVMAIMEHANQTEKSGTGG